MEETQAQQESNQGGQAAQAQPAAATQQDAAKKGKGAFLPGLIAILAAIALCVGYFLPYTAMTEEGQERYGSLASSEIISGSGVTWGEMDDASFVTWGRAYWMMYDYTAGTTKVTGLENGYLQNFTVFVASGVLAALALLCALARKATPTVLFSLLNLGCLALIGTYFEKTGPVSGTISAWAFGHEYLFVTLGVLIVAGIWLFIAKKAAKRRSA